MPRSPVLDEQMVEVQRVLAEIGADGIGQILVYNKSDRLAPDQRPRTAVDVLELEGGVRVPRVFLSALTGEGVPAVRGLLAIAAAGRLEQALDSGELTPIAVLPLVTRPLRPTLYSDPSGSNAGRHAAHRHQRQPPLIMTLPDPAVALPPESFSPMARVGALARAAAALPGALVRRLRPGSDSLVLNSGGRNDGPPDLDELWRDFNRKLSGLFGGGGTGEGPRGGSEQSPPPDMKSAGIGLGVIGWWCC